MNNSGRPQILLTNDDSISSPGLWAAAEALAPLGFVHVVAPRVQQTSMGRSLPRESDGRVDRQTMTVNGQEWQVYAVGGSPAQSVLHGLLEVLQFKPDLVVSGINYGENVASGLMVSGTVGAAIEAATLGIPALAVSLQTPTEFHFNLSNQVDFSIAGYDGIPIMQLMKPRLTTIRQDTNCIGAEAARSLIALIENPKMSIPEITVIPCALLEGETIRNLNA